MSFFHGFRRAMRKFQYRFNHPSEQADANAILLARLLLESRSLRPAPESIREAEFKVFSQFGQDGIIQHLIGRIPIPVPAFVEFGVENYLESNTRFLLEHDDWRGMVIDSGAGNIEAIRSHRLSVYHELTAVQAMVTAENINGLLAGSGFIGDIGLLSIDIDGNDYWVWKAIDSINPRIVICEYNSVFGNTRPIVVPYERHFNRERAHHSLLYWGASLPALCRLAAEKGYAFIGSNSAGNDAFFVRKEFSDIVKPVSVSQGYVQSRFRDSRGLRGEHTFLAGAERLEAIRHLPVLDLETGSVGRIESVLSPRTGGLEGG